MIFFCVPARQAEHITEYVLAKAASVSGDFKIVSFEDLSAQTEFPRGTYVLSSLDQLTPAMRSLVGEVHKRLKGVEGFRFLNHPFQTLQRFELLNELHLRGMNEFRAVRANSKLDDLRFPVFVRGERLHLGALSALLRSKREIHLALGKAVIQGYDLRDLLVVEFCDTANEEGFYRKYGAFVVGDKIIPRSLNYGQGWMLKHSGTEFTTAMAQEELDYVTHNPHEQLLKEVFRVADVQYGRIDYSMKDSKLQTWEINLYPTIGRLLRPPSGTIPPEVRAIRERVNHCFFSRFEYAWKEVNLASNELPPVTIEIDRNGFTVNDVVHSGSIRNTIRKVLRPAKPILEPLSPPFLFLLGSLARLRRS